MAIYKGEQKLVELKGDAFSSEEDDLHPIIQNNPEIILPDKLKQKKYAVFHELTVPSGFIDFLYVFEDGTLLIVEAKLAKNQEIRRKVIAQLFDYATSIRSFAPKKLQRMLVEKNVGTASFISENSFEQKLARGMKNRIILEIVTDDFNVGLNQIMGYLGGELERTELYLAKIMRYRGPDGLFFEVDVRSPEEQESSTGIGKITMDDFEEKMAERYQKETPEIKRTLLDLPAGWKLYYGISELVAYKESDDEKVRVSLNFNPHKDWILLFGKNNDYQKISKVLDRSNILGSKNTKEIYGIAKFDYRGITKNKIVEIMKKIDSIDG